LALGEVRDEHGDSEESTCKEGGLEEGRCKKSFGQEGSIERCIPRQEGTSRDIMFSGCRGFSTAHEDNQTEKGLIDMATKQPSVPDILQKNFQGAGSLRPATATSTATKPAAPAPTPQLLSVIRRPRKKAVSVQFAFAAGGRAC